MFTICLSGRTRERGEVQDLRKSSWENILTWVHIERIFRVRFSHSTRAIFNFGEYFRRLHCTLQILPQSDEKCHQLSSLDIIRQTNLSTNDIESEICKIEFSPSAVEVSSFFRIENRISLFSILGRRAAGLRENSFSSDSFLPPINIVSCVSSNLPLTFTTRHSLVLALLAFFSLCVANFMTWNYAELSRKSERENVSSASFIPPSFSWDNKNSEALN